jgi:hypothetical protein
MEPRVACFENQIPDFAEHELDRLYGSVHASLRYLRLRGEEQGASTYVQGPQGRRATVLIFRVEGALVRVLTYNLALSAEETNEFADFVFARYPGVSRILFPAVGLDAKNLRKPRYTSPHRSDVVIDPAPELALYAGTLGKAIRKNLNHKKNQLLRDFPDFELRVHDESSFSEAEVREILAFSRERIEGMGSSWNFSGEGTARLLTLLRQGGFVCVARIGGRVCGGCIYYRIGDSFTYEAGGQDERYSRYRLGFYLVYLGILEALRRKASRIHLGFMVYDYKLWLGGRTRKLDRLVIYRSRLGQLRDGPANLLHYLASNQREVLAYARLASHRKDLLGECLRVARTGLRTLKQVPKMMRSTGRQ